MTTRALRSICHRLTPDSTVLFLQNGLGVVEEVNQKVFPDPRHRPHYICGIFSHGLTHKAAFQVYYHGVGATILGLPTNKTRDIRDKDMDIGPSTDYLLRILTSPSPLMAVSKTPASFQLHQLDKLAVNSVINPLTTVMNCKNGELIHNYNSTRIMWQLLKEISSVFCALPELQDILDVRNRFPPERLRWLITRVASKTADNTSSMLQDVQAGKSTEIEYLNGYIVRRGDELGIECVANSILKHLPPRERCSREKNIIVVEGLRLREFLLFISSV
ncbi:ketopantoate reductase PanE/ApbA C terminal-domain-containing protein [Aspergillus ambiguus]|uniref:ketopantoate reductase family protein n=1 Tax=Aspergillus ambiguus TaxID=176160 RepID=UPI003CCDF7F3